MKLTARFASPDISFFVASFLLLTHTKSGLQPSGISVEHVRDLAKTTLVWLRGRHDIFTQRDKLIKTGFRVHPVIYAISCPLAPNAGVFFQPLITRTNFIQNSTLDGYSFPAL